MSHLYVCLFSNGHIKVGRSINPMARIAAHEERVSCLGVELVEHRFFECVGHVIPSEAELIRRCRDSAEKTNKNEWFEGLDFVDVCAWADEISRSKFDTNPAQSPQQAAINLACELVGSQAKLAQALGLNPVSVNLWCMGRRPIPFQWCKGIEAATNGQVTCKDLRPNDWFLVWSEPATEKAEAPHA